MLIGAVRHLILLAFERASRIRGRSKSPPRQVARRLFSRNPLRASAAPRRHHSLSQGISPLS